MYKKLLLVLSILILTVLVRADHTYTIDSDFDQGTLVGLEHTTVHNQLQISSETTTYPTMWIANAGEDSVSKWDTNANKEVARYHTWFGPLANHGAWEGAAPSRTAVDSDGNVYVANRHFDGKPADVIKILANDYIDRNGNGVIDTSYDANNDGYIQQSEMAPAMVDSNSNGIIDPNEITDERVAWVTSVGTNDCIGRALAIDLDGNIWLGCYDEGNWYKLNGTTGDIIAGPIHTGSTPYGALVDKNGILWSATLDHYLIKLDTKTLAYTILDDQYAGQNYGIALGYDGQGYTHVYLGAYQYAYGYYEYNTQTSTFSSLYTSNASYSFTSTGVSVDKDGNILVSDRGSAGVRKFTPAGVQLWNAPSQIGSDDIRGPIVDSDNNVWLVGIGQSKLSKFRGSDGSALGVWNTGLEPYTYSDAAGLSLSTSVSAGTWDVIYDSGVSDNTLGPVSWNNLVPEGTEFVVKVRSSNDGSSWSPYETVGNGVPFSTTPNGRYLEVLVSMKSEGETSPILYDLTVASEGGVPPVPAPEFPSIAVPLIVAAGAATFAYTGRRMN